MKIKNNKRNVLITFMILAITAGILISVKANAYAKTYTADPDDLRVGTIMHLDEILTVSEETCFYTEELQDGAHLDGAYVYCLKRGDWTLSNPRVYTDNPTNSSHFVIVAGDTAEEARNSTSVFAALSATPSGITDPDGIEILAYESEGCHLLSDVNTPVPRFTIKPHQTGKVSRIDLTSTSANVEYNKSIELSVSVIPENATNKQLTWTVVSGDVELYSDEACTTAVGTGAVELSSVYIKGVNLGPAQIKATSSDNREALFDFSVVKATTPDVALTEANKPTANSAEATVYTGSPIALIVPPTLPNGYTGISYCIDDGKTWSAAGEIPMATLAGDYVVKTKYIGDANHEDYILPDDINVTIAPKDISETSSIKIKDDETLAYDGTAKKPTIIVKDGEEELTEGTDYVITYKGISPTEYAESETSPTKVGKYEAVITFTGNYTGKTLTVNFEIVKGEIPALSETQKPVAKTGEAATYTGSLIQLISPPTSALPEGCKIKYAVTTTKTAPNESEYSDSIPTATEPGTYYVWYIVYRDSDNSTTDPECVEAVIAEPEETESNEQAASFCSGLKIKQTDKSIKVSWTKGTGISKYSVFATYLGKKFKKTPAATSTGNSATIKKINGKKLDTAKNLTLYVVAYDNDGKEAGRTVKAFVAGKNNPTYTNAKSIKLSKKKLSLKKGKSTSIKATIKLQDQKKKALPKKYAKELRFVSTDSKIAKVSKKGKVTAVGTGSCDIYVYAVNGLSKKVTVTVK